MVLVELESKLSAQAHRWLLSGHSGLLVVSVRHLEELEPGGHVKRLPEKTGLDGGSCLDARRWHRLEVEEGTDRR